MENYIEKPTKGVEEQTSDPIDSLKSDPYFQESPQKKGLILKIAIGVVGLVLISGGVVLGVRLWDPIWNPFRPSPEKVLMKMVEKMAELESTNINLTLDSNKFFVTANTQGRFNKDDSKYKGSLNINVKEEGVVIGVEYMGDEDSMFVKINNLPDAEFSFLTKTWVKIDAEIAGIDLSGPELAGNENLLVVKKELPNINGKYHYVLGFNKKTVRKIMKEGMEDYSLGLAPIEELDESKEEALEFFDGLELDSFIGIKDYLLYSMGFNKKVVDDFSQEDTIDLRIEFSDFNEPVNIEFPAVYMSMEEFMMMMLFGPSAESPFEMMRRSANDLIPVFNSR